MQHFPVSLELSTGSEYIYVGTQDGKVLIYHGDNDTPYLASDTRRKTAVKALAVTKDSKSLVAAVEGEIFFYKVPTRGQLQQQHNF